MKLLYLQPYVSDPILPALVHQINVGFPINRNSLDNSLIPFWNIRDSLNVTDDGVVLYADRVVIPTRLRRYVLKILHSAHQGV